MRLLLASASPRRAALLRAAGYSFATCSTDVDEQVLPGERPYEYVRRLALAKAERAASQWAGAGTDDLVVLGADTAVIVDGEILGKPADDSDAARMLRLLAGRSHVVLTGISVLGNRTRADAVEETRVFFKHLTDGQVRWYVASGEGRDKAGAYAIQGRASRFVGRIEGSYSNVVGLPVATVDELVRSVAGASGVLASGGSSEVF